jgi:hypothetical protein
MCRVAKPDGLLYASLQLAGGAHDATDDLTHINYQTLDWWMDRLMRAGWLETVEFTDALEAEPMQQKYQWDYFVCRKG